MSLLIAFMLGTVAGFCFSGRLSDALTTRRKLAYKTALAELQEAKELHAASVLRHVIASEMQAGRWDATPDR
jgi:hypothetical protein